MEALDPIDVMKVRTGYYTHLPLEQQERNPLLVSLFNGPQDGVDLAASREAFEHDLHDRLLTEFPEAMEVEIYCADGQAPKASLTEVSLTRPTEERLLIARRWVDALLALTWAHGRWLAPAISS